MINLLLIFYFDRLARNLQQCQLFRDRLVNRRWQRHKPTRCRQGRRRRTLQEKIRVGFVLIFNKSL
jgi:hypothetical protein